MKNCNLFFVQKLFIYLVLFFAPIVVFAQADPDRNAPIDGGLGLLIAAGIGYGIKKYKDQRKKS